MPHLPVMLREAIGYLDPKQGYTYFDGTLGAGGYAFRIAQIVGPFGFVIGVDADEKAIASARQKKKKEKINNIFLKHESFDNIHSILQDFRKEGEFSGLRGIVLDLGLSSDQLEDRDRGFSFRLDAPLNMSFGLTAEPGKTSQIINKWPAEQLEKILKEFAEERYAKSIVRSIVAERRIKKIETTGELLDLIRKSVPASYRNAKINCATKTFQALRIATNTEMDRISKALKDGLEELEVGGRIVVVSFHSGEDRIVKNFFRTEAKECLCPPAAPVCACGHIKRLKVLTPKPLRPGDEEVKNNPRARSAVLRAAEKIA